MTVIDDLNTAVATLLTAVQNAVDDINAELAALQAVPNQNAAVETAATNIAGAASTLTSAVAAAKAALAPPV